MSGLIAVAIGMALFFLLAPLFATPIARLSFLTIVGGFTFWYWLPAANLLTVGYVGVAFFQITASVDEACWIILASEVATLALLVAIRSLLREREQPSDDAIAFPMLGAVAFASAILFLVVRFASEGAGVLVQLALGLSSAREALDYQNLSTGANQSLVALWEVCTLWLGLFALGRHIYDRSVSTTYGLCAIAAVTAMFVGSGTRAVIMQAVFVTGLALATRPAARAEARRNVLRTVLLAVPLALLASVVSATFISRFAADAGYNAAGPFAAVADTFFANNDMTRELAFVLDTMQPSTHGAGDFLLTPVTFMLPAFLGFEKEIPAHLLTYNQIRLGIDLRTDEGNAFPGLVADFWVLFGWWGPLLFAFFVAVSVFGMTRLRLLARRIADERAYLVTGLSYLFFDFRNITGAFALVLLFGAAVLVAIGRVGPGRAVTGEPVPSR